MMADIRRGEDMELPTLLEVKNGWFAMGEGWAVDGHDKEEALRKFQEALEKHREIDARPPVERVKHG